MERVSLYFFHSNFFVLQLPVARMHVDRLSLSVNTFSWERCVGVCVRECIRHYLLYVWCIQSCWFKLTKSFAMRQAFFIQKHRHTRTNAFITILLIRLHVFACVHMYTYIHTQIFTYRHLTIAIDKKNDFLSNARHTTKTTKLLNSMQDLFMCMCACMSLCWGYHIS